MSPIQYQSLLVLYMVVYVLSNIHHPPANGNFRDEHENATKFYIVKEYNTHMGYVDKSDRMSNTYSICRRSWKWTKELSFHFLDISVLNAFLLHKSSEENCSTKSLGWK
jgi:hypothetical protein